MINKYAEIQDRILLYNACKGILRIKTASAGTATGAFLANKAAGFWDWFTSEGVQKGITGLTNASKLGGSLVGTGAQVMGAMNTAKQMGQANAQAAIEARRAQLEQARLDMMEHKINQQRSALGLNAVNTRNAGAEPEPEQGDEGNDQMQQQQQVQPQMQ